MNDTVGNTKERLGKISSLTSTSTNQNNSIHHIKSRTREGKRILLKEANTFFNDSNSVEASDDDIVVGYIRICSEDCGRPF